MCRYFGYKKPFYINVRKNPKDDLNYVLQINCFVLYFFFKFGVELVAFV